MNGLKVKEHSNLIRDIHSKAIINTNTQAFENAKLIKQRALENISLKDKINTLEDHVAEQGETLIKILEILNGIKNNT